MFSGDGAYSIKDLKDLSFFSRRDTIDMQDLKDLKRFFLTRAIAGDRPPRYGPGRGSSLHAPFGLRRSRTTVVSRSFRTLMSIVYADLRVFKVRRTLMFSGGDACAAH